MATDVYQFDPEELEGLDEEQPLVCAPKGTYRVLVKDAVPDKDTGDLIRKDRNGRPYFMLSLAIVDKKGVEDDMYKDFQMYCPMPNVKLWGPKANRNKRIQYNEIHKAFGVKVKTDFSPLDFIGKIAEAVLDIESDPTYGDKNTVSNLIIAK